VYLLSSKNVFLVFFPLCISSVGRDSSVGIATRYRLDGHCIESRWGRDFPHLSRPTALGPTQPPVQCIPGLFSSVEVKERVGPTQPPVQCIPGIFSSVEVKERVEPPGPLLQVLGWRIPFYVFFSITLSTFLSVTLLCGFLPVSFIVLSCYGFLPLVWFTLFPPFFPCCLSFLFVSLCLFLCSFISFGHFPLSYCLWLSPCVLFLPFFLLCCLSVGVCFVIIWALRSSLYRMKLSGTERLQWRCFALTRPSSIITLYVCSAQSH
jgi:hypothetical protein